MTERVRDHLGRFGVWRGQQDLTPELAAGLEQLGFGTLWVGASPGGDLERVEEFLAATTRLTVATGIVNMWSADARVVAASRARIEARFPGRFLLGVGAGHREATSQYAHPYQTLVSYVDTLLDGGVPADGLVLAALGPKVLRLAAERTAGAHPYLVPPGYTRQARDILGAGPLLAPEQKVVLEADPRRARAIGRPGSPARTWACPTTPPTCAASAGPTMTCATAAAMRSSTRWSRTAPASRSRTGSARTWTAGADHVCVQLLEEPGADPMAGYRQLAAVLGLDQ